MMRLAVLSIRGVGAAACLALAAMIGCALDSKGTLSEPAAGDQDASFEQSGGAAGSEPGGAGGVAGSAGTGNKAGSAGDNSGGKAGSAGSAGSGPGTEDCLNSADDDQDGKIDCEDEDCTVAYECVDPIPVGWEGYYRIRQFAYNEGASKEPCSTGAPAARYVYEPDDVPNCEACTCGAPSGFVCGPPHIVWSPGHTDCDSPTTPSWDGTTTCHAIPTNFATDHVTSARLTGTADVVTEGSCEPSKSTFSNLAMWKKMADLCSYMFGGGCGASACVPKPWSPYDGPVCIAKNGDMVGDKITCPSPWDNGVTIYSSGTDERKCESCSCDAKVVQCGGGAYTFSDTDQCDQCSSGCDPDIGVQSATECKDLTAIADGNQFSVKVTVPALPINGCAPSGGAPTGRVKPLGPLTVCCKPQ